MTKSPNKGRVALPASRHDAFVRAILESSDRATALIREYLPAEVRAHLSDSPPRLVDGSFVDEALRGRHTDRLFEVELKCGRPAFVFVLIEHKSTPDARTPLQILGYQLRIWERYAQGRVDRLRALPPIVPLCLYHGRETWSVPRSIFGMIDTPEDMKPFVRSLSYVLHDLGEIETDQLSENPGLLAGLAALKHAFKSDVSPAVLRRLLAELPESDAAFETAVLFYIVGTFQIGPGVLESALREARPARWEDMMGTIGEIWSRQAREEGLALGKMEGLAIGEAKALTRLLERRFGPLPRYLADRIEAADLATAERWFEAAIDAPSLDAVFGTPNQH